MKEFPSIIITFQFKCNKMKHLKINYYHLEDNLFQLITTINLYD